MEPNNKQITVNMCEMYHFESTTQMAVNTRWWSNSASVWESTAVALSCNIQPETPSLKWTAIAMKESRTFGQTAVVLFVFQVIVNIHPMRCLFWKTKYLQMIIITIIIWLRVETKTSCHLLQLLLRVCHVHNRGSEEALMRRSRIPMFICFGSEHCTAVILLPGLLKQQVETLFTLWRWQAVWQRVYHVWQALWICSMWTDLRLLSSLRLEMILSWKVMLILSKVVVTYLIE